MWEEFPSFPAKLEPPEEKKEHFLEKYVGLRARCSHTIKERKRHSDLRRAEKNFFPTFIGGLRADENSSSSNKWRHLSHEGLAGRCSHVHSRLSLLVSRGKIIFLLFQESIRNCLTFFLWDHATFHCNENVLALKNRATRKKMSSHAFCGGGGLPLKSTDGSWRREGAWREEAHNF